MKFFIFLFVLIQSQFVFSEGPEDLEYHDDSISITAHQIIEQKEDGNILEKIRLGLNASLPSNPGEDFLSHQIALSEFHKKCVADNLDVLTEYLRSLSEKDLKKVVMDLGKTHIAEFMVKDYSNSTLSTPARPSSAILNKSKVSVNSKNYLYSVHVSITKDKNGNLDCGLLTSKDFEAPFLEYFNSLTEKMGDLSGTHGNQNNEKVAAENQQNALTESSVSGQKFNPALGVRAD